MKRDRKIPRDERIRRSLEWMQRYAPLFGDFEAYRAAVAEPPPVDLLVPAGGADLAHVRSLLEARGHAVEGFSWAPHHLRVRGVSGGAGGSSPAQDAQWSFDGYPGEEGTVVQSDAVPQDVPVPECAR